MLSLRPTGSREMAPGAYLTDGRRLFRLLDAFDPNATCPFAVLEDCATLRSTPYLPDELYAMRLRLVRAGARD
jgi:hypothetical protein